MRLGIKYLLVVAFSLFSPYASTDEAVGNIGSSSHLPGFEKYLAQADQCRVALQPVLNFYEKRQSLLKRLWNWGGAYEQVKIGEGTTAYIYKVRKINQPDGFALKIYKYARGKRFDHILLKALKAAEQQYGPFAFDIVQTLSSPFDGHDTMSLEFVPGFDLHYLSSHRQHIKNTKFNVIAIEYTKRLLLFKEQLEKRLGIENLVIEDQSDAMVSDEIALRMFQDRIPDGLPILTNGRFNTIDADPRLLQLLGLTDKEIKTFSTGKVLLKPDGIILDPNRDKDGRLKMTLIDFR